MIQRKIGLIAAIPEEVKHLLIKIGGYKKEAVGKQCFFTFSFDGRDICLVLSGMGPANAAVATTLLIDRCRPDMILNFGFAGSLSSELNVGDVVSADRLLFFHDNQFRQQQINTTGTSLINRKELRHATFVTTGGIISKKDLASKLPQDTPLAVVEMETSAVAQVAEKSDIPLIAVRAISDSFEEELGFSLEEFCDKDINLQKWRVMLTFVRRPWILQQLIKLAGNSRLASKNLADTVLKILLDQKDC